MTLRATVVDTNVLVAALLTSDHDSPTAKVLDAMLDGRIPFLLSTALLTEYRKAPSVTRSRIYLETLEEVLPRLDEIYVMDDKSGGLLPLLPLRKSLEGGAK